MHATNTRRRVSSSSVLVLVLPLAYVWLAPRLWSHPIRLHDVVLHREAEMMNHEAVMA
jgi:hypothetical protein